MTTMTPTRTRWPSPAQPGLTMSARATPPPSPAADRVADGCRGVASGDHGSGTQSSTRRQLIDVAGPEQPQLGQPVGSHGRHRVSEHIERLAAQRRGGGERRRRRPIGRIAPDLVAAIRAGHRDVRRTHVAGQQRPADLEADRGRPTDDLRGAAGLDPGAGPAGEEQRRRRADRLECGGPRREALHALAPTRRGDRALRVHQPVEDRQRHARARLVRVRIQAAQDGLSTLLVSANHSASPSDASRPRRTCTGSRSWPAWRASGHRTG